MNVLFNNVIESTLNYPLFLMLGQIKKELRAVRLMFLTNYVKTGPAECNLVNSGLLYFYILSIY